MLQIREKSTGIVSKVWNTHFSNGIYTYEGVPGAKKLQSLSVFFEVSGEVDVNGNALLKLRDGFELYKFPRQSKAKAKPMAEPVEPIKETAVIEESAAEPIQTVAEPAPAPKPTYTAQQTNNAADIFGGLFSMVEQRVTENVSRMIQPALQRAAVRIEIVDTAGIVRKVDGICHDKFAQVCKLIAAGKAVYLFGPAGSGKNIMAEQVAKGLGLDYYYQSCVKDDFVLTGTPSATGEYVPSEFFKAFTKGGLFVLDEADSIPQDVSVVLNQAVANGEFTFPVVGTVKAHKDFRIIACGNTSMAGASIEYNGRYQQDGAFKNRFAFVKVGYDSRIEEALSDGNQDILDFIRELRRSAEERHVTLVCGYRQIKGLADFCKDKDFTPSDLIEMFCTQGMRVDELRVLFAGMRDLDGNKYYKAFGKMAS